MKKAIPLLLLALCLAVMVATGVQARPQPQGSIVPKDFTITTDGTSHATFSWIQVSDANSFQILKIRPDGSMEQVYYARTAESGTQSIDYYEFEVSAAYYLIEFKFVPGGVWTYPIGGPYTAGNPESIPPRYIYRYYFPKILSGEVSSFHKEVIP